MREFETTITVKRFEAIDGEVFETKEQCIHHEKILDGSRIIYPSCHGAKNFDPYGDGRGIITCRKCNGTGFLDKITSFQPMRECL